MGRETLQEAHVEDARSKWRRTTQIPEPLLADLSSESEGSLVDDNLENFLEDDGNEPSSNCASLDAQIPRKLEKKTA